MGNAIRSSNLFNIIIILDYNTEKDRFPLLTPTLKLIELFFSTLPMNAFAKRVDPDHAALTRAA